MPGSFIESERSNKYLKSKGRIQKERQWGTKVKGSSILKTTSRKVSLWKGCVNLFSVFVVFTGGQGQIISL